MTLTEFLLDRIAEDELEVGPAGPDEGAGPNGIGWAEVGALSEVLMARPSRVVAECEAKRRIVETLIDMEPVEAERRDQVVTLRWACGLLASVYADHLDFREEWRAIE